LVFSAHVFRMLPPTPAIYTLSLHDALPIWARPPWPARWGTWARPAPPRSRRSLRRQGPRRPRGGARRPATGSGSSRGSSAWGSRSEEHTSELQSLAYLVCRLLLEKKKRVVS